MIEVKIPDGVDNQLEVLRLLKEAGIPVTSRTRFGPRGEYDPVLVAERGKLEWRVDVQTRERIFRWRE